MSKIVIYGASDDLIEIEGDIREEFGAYGEESSLLGFSDGSLLEVTYTEQGFWRISPIVLNTDTFYAKAEATDPDEDYSDRVTLEGEIAWVLFGAHWARTAKDPE